MTVTIPESTNYNDVIVATGGYDHTVKLWHAKTGSCQRSFQFTGSQVNHLEISPDNHLIAAAGYQQIFFYEINSKNPNPITNFDGFVKNVVTIGYDEEGKWIYTGGEDGCVKIWDSRTMNFKNRKTFKVTGSINCVRLHPNQTELIIGDSSGVVHLWDVRTNYYKKMIPEGEVSIEGVNIDAEGSYLAAVNSKGNCYIWTLTGGRNEEPTKVYLKHKIAAHDKCALSCVFSPDSTLLVTTSADQTAKVWKTADFSLYQELKVENQRWVWDAAFSIDSQYLLTVSSDGVARLWNVETGVVKRDYNGHQKAITALAFKDQAI